MTTPLSAFKNAVRHPTERLTLAADKSTVGPQSRFTRLCLWCRSPYSATLANKELALAFRQSLVTEYGERIAGDAFSQFIGLRSIHKGRPISSRQAKAVLQAADALHQQAALTFGYGPGVARLNELSYTLPYRDYSVQPASLPATGPMLFSLAHKTLAQSLNLLSEVPVSPEGYASFSRKNAELLLVIKDLREQVQVKLEGFNQHYLTSQLTAALNDLQSKQEEVERLYVNHPMAAKNILHARHQWYKAALLYLENTITTRSESVPPQSCAPLHEAHTHIQDMYKADCLRLAGSQQRVTNPEEELQGLSQQLIKNIHHSFQGRCNKAEITQKLTESWREIINTRQQWKEITHTVPLVVDGRRMLPTCITTPAGSMDNSIGRDYKGSGFGCYSYTEATHAVNLAVSTLTIPDENGDRTIFQGLRHAVHSVMDIIHPAQRQAANLARATETLKAALLTNPPLLATVLADADNDYPIGTPIRIPLVSVSLLTPDNLRSSGFMQFFKIFTHGNEQKMLREQKQAWDTLNAHPLRLTLTNAQGIEQEVVVQPDIITFNFGVNRGAFSMPLLHRLISGWQISDTMNRRAMSQLAERVDTFLDSRVQENEKNIVRQLFDQITQIWEDKSYRRPGKEPYKLVSRIALLTHALGEIPCWNCKSGKDRTGNLDVETRFLALRTQSTGQVPEPDAVLQSEQQAALRALALASGNHELQTLNTGLPGFKLEGVWANQERLGETEGIDYFRGASAFVQQ